MGITKIKLGNPALLTWARESAGYSISNIASLLIKNEEEIANWEKGIDGPTFKQLERIANKVKRPVAAFFLPEIPEELPLPVDFRFLPGMERDQYDPKSYIAFRQARIHLEEISELLNALDIELSFSFPHCSLGDDPEKEAQKLRSILQISVNEQKKSENERRALDMWRDVLFNCGVISFVFRMPIQDVRAFSLIDETNNLAAVGLNTAEDPLPRIFSLFHEMGHLFLRRPGVSGEIPKSYRKLKREPHNPTERFCDRFAAGFLLPSDDPNVVDAMKMVRRDNSIDAVGYLARSFKVSKYVLLRRASDLGYLPQKNYWDIFWSWRKIDSTRRKKAGGGNPIATKVGHLGKRFAGVIFDALDSNQISLYEAGRLLDIEVKDFPKARTLALKGLMHAE